MKNKLLAACALLSTSFLEAKTLKLMDFDLGDAPFKVSTVGIDQEKEILLNFTSSAKDFEKGKEHAAAPIIEIFANLDLPVMSTLGNRLKKTAHLMVPRSQLPQNESLTLELTNISSLSAGDMYTFSWNIGDSEWTPVSYVSKEGDESLDRIESFVLPFSSTSQTLLLKAHDGALYEIIFTYVNQ